jgi:stage V sporulation protein AE
MFGIYARFVEFAGSGASVPLIGFGHVLAKGTEKAVNEFGLYGALTGSFTAAAAGLGAAVLLGSICAVLFNSKEHK